MRFKLIIALVGAFSFLESFDFLKSGNMAFGLWVVFWVVGLASLAVGSVFGINRAKKLAGNLLLGMTLSLIPSAVVANLQKAESLSRGDLIAAALNQYKERRGEYPEAMEQLVPEYFSSVPKSAMGLITTIEFDYQSGGEGYRLGFGSLVMIYCSRSAETDWKCHD